MAIISANNVSLIVNVPGTSTTITENPKGVFFFNSPTINASASVTLTGTAGESVADWTLGFIQLKYVGTNLARYRGATVRQGSTLVSHSNQTLCRDTDLGSNEVWYDSLYAGGAIGPKGTNKLNSGTVLPATNSLVVRAHLFDHPQRQWDTVITNNVAGGSPDNFLHYAVTELLFCTMLVAKDPAGQFTMLKHFYWNVIWEHTFKRDASGKVVLDKAIRLQQNVQAPQNGNPRDKNFFGKEYDLNLPISNDVSMQFPRIVQAADWGQS